MSTAREELHQLVDELPEEQVPDTLFLLRAGRDHDERSWPPRWFGAAEGRRTDAAERAKEIIGRTEGNVFPVRQLMRLGHTGAAFGWVAVAAVGLMLMIFGLVVAFTVSLGEGAVIFLPGVVVLLVFAVASTIHARQAPNLWNAAADERNRRRPTGINSHD